MISTVLAYLGAALLLWIALVAYGWGQICELVLYGIEVAGNAFLLPYL